MPKRRRKRRSSGLFGGGGLNFLGGSARTKAPGSELVNSKPLNWMGTYKPGAGLFGGEAPRRRTRKRKNGLRRHERRESRSYERREHRNGSERRERKSNGNGAKIGGAIMKGAGFLASRGYSKAKEFYEKDKAEMAEIRRKSAETKSAEKINEEERARRYREG